MDSENGHDGFVSTAVVCKRYGIANITLKRWMKDPSMDFPVPLDIGNRWYFRLSEIEEWERKRAAQSRFNRKN